MIAKITSVAMVALIGMGAGAMALAGNEARDLARGLSHPLASARLNAAAVIGDLGPAGRDAADALMRALMDDDNVEIRRAAIGALTRTGFDVEQAGRLVAVLGDRDWMVRERAARLLAAATLREMGLIETIVKLLKSQDRSVRRGAAIALSGARPEPDGLFVAMIAGLSDRMLNDEDWQVRSAAARAIGRHGARAQSALPALFDVLRYDEPMVAEAAIEAIGRVGSIGLNTALTDSFPSVRLGAARIAGTLGADAAETAPVLANLMNERSIPMRRTAALALGAVGPSASSGVFALVEGLKDADWSVRWASARALGRLGPRAGDAAPAVAEALRDPDSRVCEAAAFALEGIAAGARDSVGALADAVREQPSDTCKMVDVTAAAQDAQMDLGWTVRWASARALGAIHGEGGQTVTALQGALSDSVWQVRGVAALSLGRVPGASSARALMKALDDEVAAVRKAAALSLGELGLDARDALPALHRVSSDPDKDVRDAVSTALARIQSR